MRIIIAGAGDVGYHLAKLLAYEDKNIVLIDKDSEKLRHVANTLDVATIKGSSTSFKTLEEADISRADLLIAVTSSEETNLSTAIIGKHLGAKKTIARIENVEYLLNKEKLDLRSLGIDEIISPESLAAREIKRLLKDTALTDTFDFDNGKLSLLGVIIDEGSQLLGKTLHEAAYLNPDNNFITVAILRHNETIIPRGEDIFQMGDHAYFIAEPEGVERVLLLAGKQRVGVKNIMILGGSKAGFHAARRLSKKFNVKLIEHDKEKCFELADALPNVMVINGDARDVELLEEEGIGDMDAFIAVTGNSETNIISCLVAKNHGVRKTISLVENIDYIHLSQNIGVDTMINKKLIAANFIFRYIREGNVISLTSIHGVDAEILEFVVEPGAEITKDEIKNVEFPKNAIIGGVVRRGVGYTAMGNFQVLPKDRVVVLCRPECIKKMEQLFK
jgi:trk system potassium uptake protein